MSDTKEGMQYQAASFLQGRGFIRQPISETRYTEVKNAKQTCLFGLELEEKFALLLENYYEFETDLLKLGEAYRIWPSRNHIRAMQDRLLLDRRLVNLLTACRLYLDQSDHGISRLFRNPSPELNGVKEFKNNLYDDHPGYRLMEALRNHVQHSGLPVHNILYNLRRRDETMPVYFEVSVIPETRVSELAENTSFKRTVLKELERLGSKVDLRGSVREYIACFGLLHLRLRETISGMLTRDRATYEAAIDEYTHMDPQRTQLPRVVELAQDGTALDEVALPDEFLGYYDSLCQANVIRNDLPCFVSSNSDQRRS